jgi:hypothetical protein
MKKQVSEKEIDRIVVSQADDETRWEKPVKVAAKKRPISKNGLNSSNGAIKSKTRRPAHLR